MSFRPSMTPQPMRRATVESRNTKRLESPSPRRENHGAKTGLKGRAAAFLNGGDEKTYFKDVVVYEATLTFGDCVKSEAESHLESVLKSNGAILNGAVVKDLWIHLLLFTVGRVSPQDVASLRNTVVGALEGQSLRKVKESVRSILDGYSRHGAVALESTRTNAEPIVVSGSTQTLAKGYSNHTADKDKFAGEVVRIFGPWIEMKARYDFDLYPKNLPLSKLWVDLFLFKVRLNGNKSDLREFREKLSECERALADEAGKIFPSFCPEKQAHMDEGRKKIVSSMVKRYFDTKSEHTLHETLGEKRLSDLIEGGNKDLADRIQYKLMLNKQLCFLESDWTDPSEARVDREASAEDEMSKAWREASAAFGLWEGVSEQRSWLDTHKVELEGLRGKSAAESHLIQEFANQPDTSAATKRRNAASEPREIESPTTDRGSDVDEGNREASVETQDVEPWGAVFNALGGGLLEHQSDQRSWLDSQEGGSPRSKDADSPPKGRIGSDPSAYSLLPLPKKAALKQRKTVQKLVREQPKLPLLKKFKRAFKFAFDSKFVDRRLQEHRLGVRESQEAPGHAGVRHKLLIDATEMFGPCVGDLARYWIHDLSSVKPRTGPDLLERLSAIKLFLGYDAADFAHAKDKLIAKKANYKELRAQVLETFADLDGSGSSYSDEGEQFVTEMLAKGYSLKAVYFWLDEQIRAAERGQGNKSFRSLQASAKGRYALERQVYILQLETENPALTSQDATIKRIKGLDLNGLKQNFPLANPPLELPSQARA